VCSELDTSNPQFAIFGILGCCGKVWIIPADPMKAGREHWVPLTPRMLEILAALHRMDDNLHVFIGHNKDVHLSENTLLKALSDGVRACHAAPTLKSEPKAALEQEAMAAKKPAKPMKRPRENFNPLALQLAIAISDRIDAYDGVHRRDDLVKNIRTLLERAAGADLPQDAVRRRVGLLLKHG
ncbi:MAG: hypothetical protein OXC63_00160, partial [Aestuariivita sp.]|nr:hypothetical protein [Aestuariivita sp.]